MGAGPEVHGQAFNLGFAETTTLPRLLHGIADGSGTSLELLRGEAARKSFFPSVERGPVDIGKALRGLRWRPTPFDEAVRSTCRFYTEALRSGRYAEEIDDAVRSLAKTKELVQELYSRLRADGTLSPQEIQQK
eukprot:NODE_1295_length_1199_cov_69.111304_g1064_i0.p4 GENE.NODE_1295_length_1199_cov_69.111304_g1064_i0~~NODE_1295_length_1199_cov_69.111304_g1064_i0.p4  ORF type:complete len:134 (+),score=36.10 NODE_1295_length_1199_cov_69.111304_g1064_i0:769-1170(+)